MRSSRWLSSGVIDDRVLFRDTSRCSFVMIGRDPLETLSCADAPSAVESAPLPPAAADAASLAAPIPFAIKPSCDHMNKQKKRTRTTVSNYPLGKAEKRYSNEVKITYALRDVAALGESQVGLLICLASTAKSSLASKADKPRHLAITTAGVR